MMDMHKSNIERKKRNNNISDSKLTAYCGVFTALALILSYLESLIPFSFAIPGIKLGLANIVTIIILSKLGLKPAIIVSVGRIILAGILFGNITVIIYSLAGAFFSILSMWLAGHFKIFTVTGISICGAVFHNLGQLVVAAIVMENVNIMYYMLILGISGSIAGAFIGILSGIVIKNIKF